MDSERQSPEQHNTTENSLSIGRGCRFSDCNDTSAAAVCEGCWKLHTSDWLEDYPANTSNDIFEVRFKNTRRGYYRNVYNLGLQRGDIVAVEASPGHDIGIVSLTGDIVSKQMRRVGFNPQNGEFKKIYRKAKPYDIEKWREAIALEHDTMISARQIAAEMNLNMKIGDVEYQGDKLKAIFYYIADERVDFRELIKVFAEQFRIRIEMKQIGARQEAGRIGGLGSCGRELCCASWISSFNSVNTNAARSQDLSLNPQKLAGQCSKLKCCLIYELDDYLDARHEFPRINGPLQAMDGDYYPVKTDILGRTVSFSSSPGSMAGLITLPIKRIVEIMQMNQSGRKPERLDEGMETSAQEAEPEFINVIGEESITRFDSIRKKKKHRRRPTDAAAGQETPKTATADNPSQRTGAAERPKVRAESPEQQRRKNGQNGQKKPQTGIPRPDARKAPDKGRQPAERNGRRNEFGQRRNGSSPRGGQPRRNGAPDPSESRSNAVAPTGDKPASDNKD